MSFSTFPNNPFPPSTAQFEEGKNDFIQAEIDAIKDGTNIDSFGDVETALASKTNLSNIAPTFDATSGVYAVGDKVIYDGVLYEFTSAHSTAGEWDESEVQPVKVSELIDSLRSGLTNIGSYSTTEVDTGMKWIDGRVIFRKVISCGALPDTNQKNETSGLLNVTIIGIHGIAISASDTIPLPHVSSANKNAQLHYSTTLGAVMITTADDYSAYTQSYVTLLYVKNV